MEKTRICTKCKIEKNLMSDFPADSKTTNKKETRCIECKNHHARFKHRILTFNVSPNEFEKYKEEQNNKCKICKSTFNDNIRELKPCVDHCHKTGKLRGLLCYQCNIGVGNLKDSYEILISAANYVNDSQLKTTKNAMHLISELSGCNKNKLNDIKAIEKAMNYAATKAKATIINSFFHKFEPQGVTGGLVLSESHFTIHTWPEYGYAAMDFFSCGQTANPYTAQDLMLLFLEANHIKFMETERMIENENKFYTFETRYIKSSTTDIYKTNLEENNIIYDFKQEKINSSYIDEGLSNSK